MKSSILKKYGSYKDSGEDWLGDIPRHWGIRRIKYLFKEINERSVEGNEDLLSVSQYTGVTLKSEKVADGELLTNASTLKGYKKVKVGDLVSNIMLAWNGSLGFSPFDGITSPAYSIYRIYKGNHNRYFHYLFRTDLYKDEFKRNSSGVIESRLRLYTDDFFRIISILPPLPEQTAIAEFLDDKTAKIDQAIAIKKQQILVLSERKQILIHKAVTRGLNDNVALKDSGVEWIGEIPKHWELLPGFMVYRENKTKNDGMREDVVLSLSYGNIIVKPEEKLVGLVPESFETYQIVKPGDIIIRCMDLQNDKTSLRTGIAKNNGIITSAYLNLNIINNNVPDYVYNFLHALDVTKVLYKFGTGLRQNLSFNDFKHLRIPVPPSEEQNEIVIYINETTNKVETAISLKEQEISKLQEYKSSLINSVVTGKLKVA